MKSIQIYTDGACFPNPGIGGWAMVVYQNGVEVHHEIGGAMETTNNRMEFAGILAAFEWLKANDLEGTVFTDSQYCVNCLTTWWPKWKKNGWALKKKGQFQPIKNLELVKACLDSIGEAKLVWIKGHSGIIGNHRADELADFGRSLAATSQK